MKFFYNEIENALRETIKPDVKILTIGSTTTTVDDSNTKYSRKTYEFYTWLQAADGTRERFSQASGCAEKGAKYLVEYIKSIPTEYVENCEVFGKFFKIKEDIDNV